MLLTVVAANGFEVSLVGNSPLIDDGIGLANMITDNTSPILFQLIALATLPMISAVFALAVMRREVDRIPFNRSSMAMLRDDARRVAVQHRPDGSRACLETAANIPAGFLFIVATIFYVTVEALWSATRGEEKRHFTAFLGHCGFCRCPCWY